MEKQVNNTEEVKKVFSREFGRYEVIARAPGRINLIGEHTDYNDGFVFPAAIDKYCTVAISGNTDQKIRFYSMDLEERFEWGMKDGLSVSDCGWANYFLGVMNEFQKRGIKLNGLDMVFTSGVPMGAGMSSSAAIESAFGFALNELYKAGFDAPELARIGQGAEHEFAGVKCGIMDQFASCLGRENQALLLDCRSLEYNYYPLEFPDYEWVLINSEVSHSLAGSSYNERRAQCEEGVRQLKKIKPGIRALRDADMNDLNNVRQQLTSKTLDRCRYVVEENSRVMAAKEVMLRGDALTLGSLLNDSHAGLQHLYEVSCEELDFLQQQAVSHTEVAGSRMMGGGFGGCTLNLIRKAQVAEVIESIQESYRKKFGITPAYYRVMASRGAHVL